uniref:(northern house mosquito) hypothetical protein n=1 Tax=Culex pipiens TaxID=7175 RepID=A0A8D8MTG3_CULPI
MSDSTIAGNPQLRMAGSSSSSGGSSAFIKKLEQSLYCSELKNRLLLELVFKIFTILSIFFSSIFAQFKTTEIFFFLNRSIGQIKNNSITITQNTRSLIKK